MTEVSSPTSSAEHELINATHSASPVIPQHFWDEDMAPKDHDYNNGHGHGRVRCKGCIAQDESPGLKTLWFAAYHVPCASLQLHTAKVGDALL